MYKTYCYGKQHSIPEHILDDCPRMSMSHQEGVVTLRLSQNMFEGSTGCHEWEAGFFLAEYVLNHPEIVRGALVRSHSGLGEPDRVPQPGAHPSNCDQILAQHKAAAYAFQDDS